MATNRDTDDLDDDAIEELIAGRAPSNAPHLEPVAQFVRELRAMSRNTPPPRPSPELQAIFEHGLPARDQATATAVLPMPKTSRRQRMLRSISAILATVTGKVALGTVAVAATVGGAHAGGVVDVPGLPDLPPAAEEHAPADGDRGDQSGNRPDGDTGQPGDPGVDGDSVSDRATDGEPKEDGRGFGSDIADDARDGTPAEDRPTGDKPADDTPAEERPTSPEDGSSDNDPADQRPDDTPADRP